MHTKTRQTCRAAIVATLSALACLTACKKDESTPQAPPPAPTTATRSISVQGGSLAATDGRLTVTLPAGAVDQPTEVAIVKTTDTAPKGIGGVYRITPEGYNFMQPAALSFTYTEAEARRTNPALMAVAFKKADGSWEVMPEVQVDERKRTVTTRSRHFSEWTLVEAEEGITFSTPSLPRTTFPVSGLVSCKQWFEGQPDSTLYMAARPAIATGDNDAIDILVRTNAIIRSHFDSGKELNNDGDFTFLVSLDMAGRSYFNNFDFADDGSTDGDSTCHIKVMKIGRKVGEYNVGSFSMPVIYHLTKGDTLAPPVKEVMTGYFRLKTTE